MGFVSYAAILEVMDETDLSRFGITSGATTKLDYASTQALNELMGIIGRRYDRPTALPASGGSRAALLSMTRLHVYQRKPETLIVTTPGGGMGTHPVVYAYKEALRQAAAVLAYEAEWPELTEGTGMEEGAWGSDKRVYDAWDGVEKTGDDAATDNDELFHGQIDPGLRD